MSLMIYSSIEKYDGVLFPSHKDAGHHGSAGTTPYGAMTEHAFGDHTEPASHMSYDHEPARFARSAGASISSQGFISNDPLEAKIMIGMALAIICGIAQVSASIQSASIAHSDETKECL